MIATMELVFDLETQKTFEEVGGRDQLEQLKVSVVGVYSYTRDQYLTFEEHQMRELEMMFRNSTRVIGFNVLGFDFPVLAPYLSFSWRQLKVLDLMRDIERMAGHRVSLDSVAQATLGVKKSGHGLDAIRYYREGNWTALKAYCLQDVKLTKEIYEYGKKHRKVHYTSKHGGEMLSVPVHWS